MQQNKDGKVGRNSKSGKRGKLFIKVFVGVFLIQVILGFGLLFFLYKVMPLGYNTTLQNQIGDEFYEFTDSISSVNSGDYGPLVDKFLEKMRDRYPNNLINLFLTDNDFNFEDLGEIYATNSKLSINSKAEYSFFEGVCFNSPDNIFLSNTTMEISIEDWDGSYMIVMTYLMSEENFAYKVITEYLPWFVATIVVVALISSFIFGAWVVRPIKRISDVASDLSNLNFDRKCNSKRKDEIGLIGDSLDHLSSELQRTLFELQERNLVLEKEIERANRLENQRSVFFSAAAHELKTPLSIVDGQLNGMIDKVGVYENRDVYLRKSLANVRRMEKTVKDILAISRLQAGTSASEASVDVSDVLFEQINAYEELYEAKNIVPEVSAEEGLFVQGNYELIKDALGAILANACLYSSQDADVVVKAYKEDEFITVEVENYGAHIPEEHLERLHEAFYRTDKSRNSNTGGSGLGLYLVKLVAESHKGKYSIKNTSKGVISSISLRSTQTP